MIPPVLFGVRKSILGLFLVIGIFGGSYFFIPSFRDSIERFFLNNEDAVLTEELAGKIYMSLTPLDELGEPTYIGIYAYDLITKELEEVLLGSAKREFLTSKISPNGSKVALSVLDSEGSMKLFVSNQNFAEMEEVPIGQPLTIIRNPSWSKDGTKIAFMGKYDDVSDAQDIESWQVYVHDFKTASTSLLTNGTNPVFLPDGGIAVLKKDGLYRITFDDGQGVLVLGEIDGAAQAHMKLDVSNDGTKIAWATPNSNMIRFFEVSSWAPFTIAKTTNIPSSVFWPVFSPDGDYFVAEEFTWKKNEDGYWRAMEQRLVLHSVRDNTAEGLLDLTPFYQESMFVTDWR